MYREANCGRLIDKEKQLYEDYKQPQLRVKVTNGEYPYFDIDFETKELAMEWLHDFCGRVEYIKLE